MGLRWSLAFCATLIAFSTQANDLYKRAEKDLELKPKSSKTANPTKSPSGLLKAQLKHENIMPTYDELKVALISSVPNVKIIAPGFKTTSLANNLGAATHFYAYTKDFNSFKYKLGGSFTALAGQTPIEHARLPQGEVRSFVIQPTLTQELKYHQWPRVSLMADLGYSYYLISYSSPDKFNNFSDEQQKPIFATGARLQLTDRFSFFIKRVLPLQRRPSEKVAIDSGHTVLGLEGGIN